MICLKNNMKRLPSAHPIHVAWLLRLYHISPSSTLPFLLKPRTYCFLIINAGIVNICFHVSIKFKI